MKFILQILQVILIIFINNILNKQFPFLLEFAVQRDIEFDDEFESEYKVSFLN